MSRSRAKARGRKRVGRVSIYEHHGAWWIYHREGARQVRKRIAETKEAAEQVAAQVNSQLSTGTPTLFPEPDSPTIPRTCPALRW